MLIAFLGRDMPLVKHDDDLQAERFPYIERNVGSRSIEDSHIPASEACRKSRRSIPCPYNNLLHFRTFHYYIVYRL